nr:hypothetical protein [Tanacetum cinerariifolium]
PTGASTPPPTWCTGTTTARACRPAPSPGPPAMPTHRSAWSTTASSTGLWPRFTRRMRTARAARPLAWPCRTAPPGRSKTLLARRSS